MQAHWRRWSRLGRASGDAREEETAARREWRADANDLLGTARAWLGEESGIARHLDAMPGARAGLETAVRDVERVRTRDNYRVFERRWRAAREKAARDRVPAIDVEGYAEVAALGSALLHADALDAPERASVARWQRAHDEAAGLRGEMERYPSEVAALREVRYSLDLTRDGDGGFDPVHPGYQAWRADAGKLLGWGRSMLALHLPAPPQRRARVVREAAALEAALRADLYPKTRPGVERQRPPGPDVAATRDGGIIPATGRSVRPSRRETPNRGIRRRGGCSTVQTREPCPDR